MGNSEEEFFLTTEETRIIEKGDIDACLNNTANLNLSGIFNSCFNFSNTSSFEDNVYLENIVSIVVPILFGIIFLLGLVGNVLVVIVVGTNKSMRNTTNLLIINLAIADLLFIILCVPFTASDYIFGVWPYGQWWCQTVQYLILVTAYISVYTLVLMSVDRFLAVVYPVASISIRTERNTLWAIGITWIFILVSCAPAFVTHTVEEYIYAQETRLTCTFDKRYNNFAFQLIFFLTSYTIPLTLICLLYFGMLFRLSQSVSGTSRQSLRGKKRVTRMIVVVVGVFAVCWLPIQVVLLLKSIQWYAINNVTIAVQITAHILGYMNSCVNPILYAFLSENFRKAFRKVIQCNGNLGSGNIGLTKETAVTLGDQNGGNHRVNTKKGPAKKIPLEEEDAL